MRRKTLIATAVLLLVPEAASADGESFEARILSCAEAADDARRLSCYDREAARLSKADKESGGTADESAGAAAVRQSAPPGPEAEDFGMTAELAESRAESEQEVELREITAEVVDVSRRPRGEHVVTLDNGQIWTEKSAKFGFSVEIGDTVVIKKGLFGGYRMVGRGNRASRVRRIE